MNVSLPKHASALFYSLDAARAPFLFTRQCNTYISFVAISFRNLLCLNVTMQTKKTFFCPVGIKSGCAGICITTEQSCYNNFMEREAPEYLAVYHMKKERNNSRKPSSEIMMVPSADGDLDSRGRREVGRRSFLRR
jgi:hypothetical protein